jgi:hypothetical protein
LLLSWTPTHEPPVIEAVARISDEVEHSNGAPDAPDGHLIARLIDLAA